MPFILNTSGVDEGDRAEFVHEALAMTMVPVELHWPQERRGVAAHGVITNLGHLTVCSGRTSAFKVQRTPALARDALEPSIFVNVQLSGSSMVIQGDHEAVLHPGELVIYDSTAPYTLLNETGMTGEFFRIPHSALAMPHNAIRKACAVSLSPGHPLTSLTNDFLKRVTADRALYTAPNADKVGRPIIELVRAVIATHLKADELSAGPLAATLPLRILEYVRNHLYDAELSVEQIAAAHYISVRYLYKVLAERGIASLTGSAPTGSKHVGKISQQPALQPPSPSSRGATDSPTCPALAARSALNTEFHRVNGVSTGPLEKAHSSSASALAQPIADLFGSQRSVTW